MKLTVKLLNENIFINPFSWVMDWTAPYFPRVGDGLNAGIFIHGCGLTPELFGVSLVDSYQSDWMRDLKKYAQTPETLLKIWLNELDFNIIRVEWDIQDGQTVAIIYVN